VITHDAHNAAQWAALFGFHKMKNEQEYDAQDITIK
jgi:hypothetical protein